MRPVLAVLFMSHLGCGSSFGWWVSALGIQIAIVMDMYLQNSFSNDPKLLKSLTMPNNFQLYITENGWAALIAVENDEIGRRQVAPLTSYLV